MAAAAPMEVKGAANGVGRARPYSAEEINFLRLLSRCEHRLQSEDPQTVGADLRFCLYVADLEHMLGTLEQLRVQAEPSGEGPGDEYAGYMQRVEALVSVLSAEAKEQLQKSLFAPESDAEEMEEEESESQAVPAQLQGDDDAPAPENALEHSGQREEPDPTEAKPHVERSVERPQLRQRGAANGSRESSGTQVSIDERTKLHLEQQQELQEGLTDELVRLAASMKENSYAMQRGVNATSKLLDKTEVLLAGNVSNVKKANVTAARVYKKTWATSCTSWIMLLAVGGIFTFMFVFIRLFPA